VGGGGRPAVVVTGIFSIIGGLERLDVDAFISGEKEDGSLFMSDGLLGRDEGTACCMRLP